MIRRLLSLALLLAAVAFLATHSIPEDWHWLVVAGLWVQHVGAAVVHGVLGRAR